MTGKRIDEKTSVFSLAWPIFIELFLFMLMGNIDTFMLSRFSDNSVAAVGNANQIVNTLIIIFNITATATGIMVAQYLGAKNKEKLDEVYSVAFLGNIIMAVGISFLLIGFQKQFFVLINLPQELVVDTKAYLDTIVGFLFVPALFMTLSAILKNHGMTKLSMYLSIIMNLLNVVGNYIFLFGPFGLPVLGIKGVAISTVVSRSIGVIIMIWFIKVKMKGRISIKLLYPWPKETVRKLLKLGIPSAGEPIAWQFSQMFIFAFINLLGTVTVTARMYSMIITWFTFLASLAIAQASSIVVGHLVGAGKEDQAYKLILRSLKKSLILSVTIAVLFAIFRNSLLGIFTDSKEIIMLAGTILIIDIFLEIGRTMNLVIIGGLRAAGDVHFPVIVGVISMWGVSTLGAYIFGLKLGWGLPGIWLAMALDELLRGIIMLLRWKFGGWRNKSIVEPVLATQSE